MRVRAGFVLLLAACSGPGYRTPKDSGPMRDRLEDDTIASRVRVVLGEDPDTAPYDSIRVRCVDGVVFLEGAVDRPEVRRRAAKLARGCEGVVRVVDRISVRTASG